jgi:hypothetical protein
MNENQTEVRLAMPVPEAAVAPPAGRGDSRGRVPGASRCALHPGLSHDGPTAFPEPGCGGRVTRLLQDTFWEGMTRIARMARKPKRGDRSSRLLNDILWGGREAVPPSSPASGFAGQLPASLASYAGTRRPDKTPGQDGAARPGRGEPEFQVWFGRLGMVGEALRGVRPEELAVPVLIRGAVPNQKRVRAFGDCAGARLRVLLRRGKGGWESHFPTGKGRRAGSEAGLANAGSHWVAAPLAKSAPSLPWGGSAASQRRDAYATTRLFRASSRRYFRAVPVPTMPGVPVPIAGPVPNSGRGKTRIARIADGRGILTGRLPSRPGGGCPASHLRSWAEGGQAPVRES